MRIKSLIYFIYFIIICLIFISFTDLFPFIVSWYLLKLVYLFIMPLALIFLLYYRLGINKKVNLYILFYSILVLFSNLINHSLSDAVFLTITYGIFYFLLVYVVFSCVCIFNTKELLRPFILSLSFIILVSLLRFLGVPITLYSGELLESSFSDASVFSGVFVNQNSLGMISSVASILYFYKFNYSDGNKYIWLFLLVLALVMLVSTLSRASLLLVALFYALFFFHSKFGIKKLLFINIASPIIIVLVFCFFSVYLSEYSSSFIDRGDSGRSIIWGDALLHLKSHLMIGSGAESYFFITDNGSKLSTHNVYLTQMVSFGLFGFVFWVFPILFFLVKYYLDIVLNKINEKGFFFFLIVFSIAIHQLFESSINHPLHPLTLVFFTSLALSLSARQKQKQNMI